MEETRIHGRGVSAAASRQWAGLLLLLAGAAILMGIITAEALYPETYTTHDSEISDLGATRPPDSVSHQPSSTIFNTLMIVTGVMTIASALLVHRTFEARRVTLPMLMLGVGVLGVGVFPGNYSGIHPIFALLASLFGGITAITSSYAQASPLKFVSIVLGVVCLASLVIGVFGDSTVIFEELGDGGIERWVAYPVVIWMVAFGAYLTAREPAGR